MQFAEEVCCITIFEGQEQASAISECFPMLQEFLHKTAKDANAMFKRITFVRPWLPAFTVF